MRSQRGSLAPNVWGNHPSLIAKRYLSRNPSAKLGIAISRNVISVDPRSTGLLALDAAHSAQGTEITTANSCAITRIINERGARSFNSSDTGGCPSVLNCTPKSPVAKSPSHLTYLT